MTCPQSSQTAARRRGTRAAGFDGVEAHGANGFLLDQFLQDGSNRRTDAYGGMIENRGRLLLQVVDAVAADIGADRTAVRLSRHGNLGGLSDSDTVPHFSYVIRELGTRALAYLHLIEPRASSAGIADDALVEDKLKPGRTQQALIEEVAQQFAELAMRLRLRGHAPQAVAHFVNRLVLCMFAEEADPLPNSLFKRLLQHCLQRTDLFPSMVGQFFSAMRTGGFAVRARIRTVFADRGYDAESSRTLCRSFGAEPHIHKRRQPSGSSLGQQRWPVERSNAGLLENRRLALRYDRLGFIIQALLQTACILLAAGRLTRDL